MNIRFHEQAKHELDEAIEWYDMQAMGVGGRFKVALRGLLEKVKLHPDWFLKEEDDVYKAYVPKFPYKVLYTIEKHELVVWAIAHLHRRPRYWNARVRRS